MVTFLAFKIKPFFNWIRTFDFWDLRPLGHLVKVMTGSFPGCHCFSAPLLRLILLIGHSFAGDFLRGLQERHMGGVQLGGGEPRHPLATIHLRRELFVKLKMLMWRLTLWQAHIIEQFVTLSNLSMEHEHSSMTIVAFLNQNSSALEHEYDKST